MHAKRLSGNATLDMSKPPCKIDAKAIISDKAILIGSHLITIGEGTVIHPYAKIDSTHASVAIGRDCIIAERAIIGVVDADTSDGIRLQDYVTVETAASVHAMMVGKGSTIGVQSILGAGSCVGEVGIPLSCFQPA